LILQILTVDYEVHFDMKKPLVIWVIALLVSSSFFMISVQAQENKTCEQCGMSLDATAQARFTIVDASGGEHLACCPICALKLQKVYGDLNITSFCDYNGPDYPITIDTRNNGTEVLVTPSSALIIVGGSCKTNRLVYDAAAADALLASPNNGTSRWLSPLTNDTVAVNATRMGVVQAALKNGAGAPSTSASPSPSPSSSGVTFECEVCGMDVSPESQATYIVTDGNGNVHYVECFMCALSLINDYETLHIQTYCDWYGPDYSITVDSSNYGGSVSVSPSTAVFLRGGSCVTARAAYNQTAADNLLVNGYSQYTSPEQRFSLPSGTEVKMLTDAINAWYAQPSATGTPTVLVLALACAVGVVLIGLSLVAYKRLKT
jgi:hypothetical protein